ncbi:DapH/DapD/GlmU-related protein [Candidatus Uabimicrobium sp. HlEnr_7]|uniref:DapH/DapD/GlmU-related protein n=1 Tax=Candidatus Uabimicrobium helgolandensis TaxID=3095367 RepID=UPI003556E802
MEEEKKSKRVDIDSKVSTRGGFAGMMETGLRKFRSIVHCSVLLLLYVLASILIGLALVPSIYFVTYIYSATHTWFHLYHYAAFATSIAAGYFIYGFTLILIVLPFANFILRLKLKPWRGIYYSLEAVPWYVHNGFTYIARYTFLFMITPTPFSMMFYKLMGMKIGRGTQLNTTNISDPSLITLEEKVTIGGSATIIAHYGQAGYLVINPVRIGKGAVIGLKATIMGGVNIGVKAKILANSFVMPNTVIPDGEVWGGVPAVCIRKAKPQEEKIAEDKQAKPQEEEKIIEDKQQTENTEKE